MDEPVNYFENLPNEMIINIFSYLPWEDIKSTRLTCRSFEILLADTFVSRGKLQLDHWNGFRLSDSESEHNWIFKTRHQFANVDFNEMKFNEVDGSVVNKFFDKFGAGFIEVKIKYCRFNEEMLYQVFERLQNVKKLSVGIRGDIDYAKLVSTVYPTVECLEFDNIPGLDKTTIDAIPPELESKITELYVPYISMDNYVEGALFKDTGVYSLLKRVSKTLKKFSIFSMTTYPDLLSSINELKLNLDNLEICLDDGITDDDFREFCSTMSGLKELKITGNGVEDGRACLICEKMTHLRGLRFYEIDILLNTGIQNASKLKELEYFSVNTCQNFSNKGISGGIAHRPNPTLKRLELYGEICDETFIATVINLPNLNHLHLATDIYFSADLIPLVYERLPKLRLLSLSSLNSPRDNMWEPHITTNSLTPPPRTIENARISMLKDLDNVSFSGYTEIPGATLDDLSEVVNLKVLSLNDHKAITKEGIIKILKNCKHLKSITLRRCNEFLTTDEDRTEIISCFPKRNFQFKIDFKVLK